MQRALAGLLFAASLSSAHAITWVEDFDSYANGTALDAIGGWKGWNSSAAKAGEVSNAQYSSAANSMRIKNNADAIREFSGVTSGQWSLTFMLRVPSSYSGISQFSLLGSYADNGTSNEYAVSIRFDGSAASVVEQVVAGSPAALVKGSWVQLAIAIDLDANTRSTYYNGSLLSSGAWTVSSNDMLAALEAKGIGGAAVNYDNFNLQPVSEASSLIVLGFVSLLVGRRMRRS